jgi:hypothetical protein
MCNLFFKVAKLNAIEFAWNPTLGRRWSKNKEQRSRTTNWDGQFEKLKALNELSAGGTDLRSLIEQDKSLEAWMKVHNSATLYSHCEPGIPSTNSCFLIESTVLVQRQANGC